MWIVWGWLFRSVSAQKTDTDRHRQRQADRDRHRQTQTDTEPTRTLVAFQTRFPFFLSQVYAKALRYYKLSVFERLQASNSRAQKPTDLRPQIGYYNDIAKY